MSAKPCVKWTPNNIAVSLFPGFDYKKELGGHSFTNTVLFADGFKSQPEGKLAIADSSGSRTFGDLRRGVAVVRHFASHELGLTKGDVATFISPNHIDYFSVVHGLVSAGATVSPINPMYTSDEIGFQLRASKSKVIVAHVSCLENAKLAAKECDVRTVVVLGGEAPGLVSISKVLGDPASPKADISSILARGEDVAFLPFSSGTTGLPKGTMLTHANLVSNLFQMEHPEGRFLGVNDVSVSPLPFFHIYAFMFSLNFTLSKGNTLITSPSFDMEEFCKQVERYRVRTAHLVPPVVLGLTKSPVVRKYNMTSLERVLSGAAPLGKELENEMKRVFPSIKVCKQGWGMSELSPVGTMVSDDADFFPGSVGTPVAMTEVKICDVGNPGIILPPNTEGELLIRGPQVMRGYLEAHQTKECMMEDGFMRTGDIAVMNELGYIFITDRLKELIKVKGFQVAPAELEALLVTHPSVADAVVIPRPTEDGDEVPRAYIVLGGEAKISEEELVEWAGKKTIHYKKLKGGVRFTKQIPKTASGKILRREVVKADREKEPVGSMARSFL